MNINFLLTYLGNQIIKLYFKIKNKEILNIKINKFTLIQNFII
jgi:hypothetical protein